MPNQPQDRRLGLFPLIAISIVAVTALLVVAYVLIQWWNAYEIHSLMSADIQDKLDSYKVQVEDLQRLVSLLIAFSSLYALVLGVASYLSAKDLLKQSEDNAMQIEKLKGDLVKSFPFFTRMGERMMYMKVKLEHLMPDSDERDDYYDRLSVPNKEFLKAAEQSAVSWLSYLDFSESAEIASAIYRNLGKYYGARRKEAIQILESEIEAASQLPPDDRARYIDEKERRRQIQSLADRANFFFSSAIQIDPNDFLAFNDIGFLTRDLEGALSTSAENFYRTSIRLQPKQQRAYYNLAIIQHDRGNYKEAEDLSSRALSYPNWQILQDSERADDVKYNRACYRSHLGAQSPKEGKKWADSTEEDLRQACRGKSNKRLELLNYDCLPNGDLAWFATERPKVIEELKLILG